MSPNVRLPFTPITVAVTRTESAPAPTIRPNTATPAPVRSPSVVAVTLSGRPLQRRTTSVGGAETTPIPTPVAAEAVVPFSSTAMIALWMTL